MEIHKQAYLSNCWTDLHQIWIANRYLPHRGHWGPKLHLLKNQHGCGRHLEFSIFGQISVVNEDIFIKFGTLIDIGHTMVTVAKYPIFGKIQDGGGRHLECSIYGHISVVNEDILVTFGTLIDIGHTRVTVAQYPTFDKIQDGGRHLEFSIFGHISVVNEDIFVKFGTMTDIGHRRVTVAKYPTYDKFQDGVCQTPSWFCILAAYRSDH